MVDKDFQAGDLVWARMKGYPPWPAKIIERETAPFKKSHHHYVYFFGSQNHAWILDENICPHSPSMIADYEKKKKPLKALQKAIDDFTEYVKTRPSTSTPDEKLESSDDAEADSSRDVETRSEESSNPVADGSAFDALTFKHREQRKSQNKNKVFHFGKKKVCFSNFGKPKAKITSIRKNRQAKNNLKRAEPSPYQQPERKAEVLSDNVGLESTRPQPSLPETSRPQPSLPKRTYVAPTEKKIGFLGLELMGQGIVKNLLKSGHDVTVWNRQIRHMQSHVVGAHVCRTPKEVVQKCDIIFCCVDASEVSMFPLYGNDGVLMGLTEARGGTKGYVEMTPLGEQASKDIAEAVHSAGAMYLEVVPLSGPFKLVEDGELTICASGDKKLFKSCSSVFHAISKHAFYIGEEVGKASTYGLAFSVYAGIVSVALGEGMAAADDSNVPKDDVKNYLSFFGYSSQFLEEQVQSIADEGIKFEPSIILGELQKEMGLALQLGEMTNLEMSLSTAANQMFLHAKMIGLGLKDASAVYLASKL